MARRDQLNLFEALEAEEPKRAEPAPLPPAAVATDVSPAILPEASLTVSPEPSKPAESMAQPAAKEPQPAEKLTKSADAPAVDAALPREPSEIASAASGEAATSPLRSAASVEADATSAGKAAPPPAVAPFDVSLATADADSASGAAATVIAPAAPPAAAPSQAGPPSPGSPSEPAAKPIVSVSPDLPDAAARAYAVDPRRNVVLEASAGTGKTSVLVARYLNLLSMGVDPSNILAMTFTRKAAAEMRERIVAALRRAAVESVEGRARWMALRDRLNDVAISTIDAFCYGLLREFPLEAGLDPAFTLADETEVARLVEEALDHAIRVCQGLARDDEEVALVFARLTLPRLRGGLAHLLERRLVAQAALARYLQRGPRDLSIAVAAERAADRMRATLHGLPGGLEAFLADGPQEHPRFRLLASDLRTLERAGDRAAGGAAAAADADAERAAHSAPANPLSDPARLAAVFDEIRAYFLTQSGTPRTRLTGYAADHCLSRAAWKRHCDAVKAIAPSVKQALDAWNRDLNVVLARGVQRMFAVALTEYRSTLAEHEVLDFADVLGRAVELLRQMDEFSQSRYRLESRYHHVLVDEFQDTSRMQWELVSLLVASWGEGFGLVHEAPLPPSLFVVGDRKQSIYRFRDADVSLLDDASRMISSLRPEGPVRRVISRSFRSVPALLSFVNDLCGALPETSTRGDAFRFTEDDRFPLEGLTDPFAAAMASASDARAAATVTATAAATEPAVATATATATATASAAAAVDIRHRLRPAPLGVIVGPEIEDTAASVAREIARLLKEGIVRDRDTGIAREARPGDIAILFRSRDSHREFEQALEARGIPSYVYKGLGFFDADEIKDLSALMRYLAAPESHLRAAAFLRSRFVRLSDGALRTLGPELAVAMRTPDAAAGLDPEDQRVLAQVRASLPSWLALVDRLSPAELIDHVLATSAYGLEIAGIRGHQARENVKKMRALVRRIQNRGYATLGRIAEHLDRLSAGDEANATIEAIDAVSLMTVHASKGLEFPVVFVVNLARGVASRRQPIRVLVDAQADETNVAVESYMTEADTLEPLKEREETKRLLYVAMTRARDTLYLSTVLKDGQFKATPGSLGSIMPSSMATMFAAAARVTTPSELVYWTASSGNTHPLIVVSAGEAGHDARPSKPAEGAARDTGTERDTNAMMNAPAVASASASAAMPPPSPATGPAPAPPAPTAAFLDGDAIRVDAESLAANVAVSANDAWPRVRVTGAASASAVAGARRWTPGSGDAAEALVGRLVHRLFQARVDPDAGAVTLARHAQRLLRAEEHIGLDAPEAIFERAATLFQRIATRDDVRALLASGQCLFEVPFSMRATVPPGTASQAASSDALSPDSLSPAAASAATPPSHLIIRGTIDCLVHLPDGSLLVVEFKTGAPHVTHDEQLALYVDATRAVFPDKPVAGRVIYP